MKRKRFKLLLPVLVVGLSIPALSQANPDMAGQTGRGLPVSVGVAYSNYATDFNGRLSGATLWSDWNFYKLPPLLDGFGLEVEARDLNYHRTGDDPKLRTDTIAGGLIYTTHFYRRFHPYGKFLIGYGSMDLTSNDPTYGHDTRTIYVPGGGVDTRVYKSLWLRANYEYQIWPDFYSKNQTMNPSGIDVGFAYDFGGFR